MLSIVILFIFARWYWVQKMRVDMMYNDRKNYEKLDSITKMIVQFWIWDVYKFVKKGK